MRFRVELPKAHLHLHFTGSMRHTTLLELAERDGHRLPDALVQEWPPQLSAADEKGWFRFQRLYDVARSVLRTEDDVRRLVREAAEDDARDGARWLEIQVDPSGYAARFGGITAFTDLVLDAVREASRDVGIGMAVVIAANRTRHPLDARTLARLAAQYAGRGVVGFGLSNDERRGSTRGLRRPPSGSPSGRAWLLVPHGGELRRPGLGAGVRGPAATRTDSGTASGRRRTPRCSSAWSSAGIALEVCPVSNVALGVYSDLDLGAAARAARGGSDDRAGRRRPVAVRLPARAASTPRCGPRTSSTTPSWPSSRRSRSGRRGHPRRTSGCGWPRSTQWSGTMAAMSTYPGEDPQQPQDERAEQDERGGAEHTAPITPSGPVFNPTSAQWDQGPTTPYERPPSGQQHAPYGQVPPPPYGQVPPPPYGQVPPYAVPHLHTAGAEPPAVHARDDPGRSSDWWAR